MVSNVTIGSNLGVNVSTSSSTICSGNTVTLTASAAATTYSWSTGATTSVIAVTPSVTTTYSVGAMNGLCVGGNTITVNVNASPNLSVSLSPACVGESITINASGANTYTYLGSSSNPQTIASPSVSGGYFFTVAGSNSNGCMSSGVVNFTVYDPPTVTASSSPSIQCVGQTVILIATGADTYSWTGAATSSNASFSYTTPLVPGNVTFSVVGTETTGCSAQAVVTLIVSTCTGIEKLNGGLEASVNPNPFSNSLQLSGVEGTVEIYNAIGQVVLSAVVKKEQQELNTSALHEGAYILKAYDKQGAVIKTIKLIKE